MVFQFEHVGLDHGGEQVGRPAARAARPQGHVRPLAGRARRRRLEQPLLEQPRPAAGRVALRRRRRAPGAQSAKMLATVLHLHRGTPYVYQGEELGMTNAPFAGRRRLPRHRVAQPLRRGGRGRRPARSTCCAALRATSRDNARTPMQWDADRARRLHHRHAVAPGQPEPRRDQRGGRARRPELGVPPLPAADRAAPHRAGRRARRLHDAAAGRTSRCTRSPARTSGDRAARARQLLRRAGAGRGGGLGGRRAAARQRRRSRSRARSRRGRRGSTGARRAGACARPPAPRARSPCGRRCASRAGGRPARSGRTRAARARSPARGTCGPSCRRARCRRRRCSSTSGARGMSISFSCSIADGNARRRPGRPPTPRGAA